METTRRGFLGALSGIAAAMKAGLGIDKPAAVKPCVLDEFEVAGFRYYDGPKLLHAMKVGDALSLQREPTNSHDEWAVRIDWRKNPIGYVPRTCNWPVAKLLDQGAVVACETCAVDPHADSWRGVTVRVSIVQLPA